MYKSLTGILAPICIVLLLALLIEKELFSVGGSSFQKVSKTLNIAIIPLLIAFVLIVITKVVEVIG
jgi:hypothetical protein